MIQNESIDTQKAVLCVVFSGDVYVTMKTTFQVPACQVHHLHCDVAAENKHTFPPFGSSSLTLDYNGVFAINAYRKELEITYLAESW